MMNMLRRIFNGQTRYGVWKTIRIGGVSAEDLCARGDEEEPHWRSACLLMRSEDFTVLDTEEEIDLISLKMEDFGYPGMFTDVLRGEIVDPAFLAKWSRKNLQGYVLDLCPAEVGPRLYEVYQAKTPSGEPGHIVDIMMKPLKVARCDFRAFYFYSGELVGDHCSDRDGTATGREMIFCLRKT